MTDRTNTIIDVVICMILILTSLSFLHNLNVLSSKNNTYRANQMVSTYLGVPASGNLRLITLDE